jgi:hypothetical protein
MTCKHDLHNLLLVSPRDPLKIRRTPDGRGRDEADVVQSIVEEAGDRKQRAVLEPSTHQAHLGFL